MLTKGFFMELKLGFPLFTSARYIEKQKETFWTDEELTSIVNKIQNMFNENNKLVTLQMPDTSEVKLTKLASYLSSKFPEVPVQTKIKFHEWFPGSIISPAPIKHHVNKEWVIGQTQKTIEILSKDSRTPKTPMTSFDVETMFVDKIRVSTRYADLDVEGMKWCLNLKEMEISDKDLTRAVENLSKKFNVYIHPPFIYKIMGKDPAYEMLTAHYLSIEEKKVKIRNPNSNSSTITPDAVTEFINSIIQKLKPFYQNNMIQRNDSLTLNTPLSHLSEENRHLVIQSLREMNLEIEVKLDESNNAPYVAITLGEDDVTTRDYPIIIRKKVLCQVLENLELIAKKTSFARGYGHHVIHLSSGNKETLVKELKELGYETELLAPMYIDEKKVQYLVVTLPKV
jgi:hypothetical protein